jgi:hypothetical protein
MLRLLLAAAFAAIGLCQYSVASNSTNSSTTYTNPILDDVGADPYVRDSK